MEYGREQAVLTRRISKQTAKLNGEIGFMVAVFSWSYSVFSGFAHSFPKRIKHHFEQHHRLTIANWACPNSLEMKFSAIYDLVPAHSCSCFSSILNTVPSICNTYMLFLAYGMLLSYFEDENNNCLKTYWICSSTLKT